ncbi:MAG: branched-chain amino acid ABC transporter permease [Nitrososphaerota archaeon]|nr:branched-chain amino acid ABC transporter permease [Nitrososphaerota archaeon]
MLDPTISNSIIYGSLVGLMCVGLTVTYLTTKVPNFAAADFVVVGTYATAASYILWNVQSPYLTTPLGVLFAGISGVVMYLIVLRPLIRRGSSLVVLMIATLAIDIIFSGIFALFVHYMGNTYGRILNDKGYGGQFYLLGQLKDFQIFGNSGLLVVAPTVLVLLSVSLFLLLTKSKFGVAMRAAIENANLARTVGINVERVNLVSWFLAGGIAGLSGGLLAIWTATPQGNSSLIIVDIFAGSVLGGLGSIYGAIIGGLIIGASETYLAASLDELFSLLYGPNVGAQILQFQKGIPLAIMIIVLLVAPRGLTGVNWRRVGKKLGVMK